MLTTPVPALMTQAWSSSLRMRSTARVAALNSGRPEISNGPRGGAFPKPTADAFDTRSTQSRPQPSALLVSS